MTPSTKTEIPPTPLTAGPNFHFFGYYDKSPWDPTGRFVLAMESDFMDHRPGPEDVAGIGIVDTGAGHRFEKVGETVAWNWQQGCMLQWRPGSGDEILFNTRDGDRFVAIVANVRTGAQRTLPRPIYGVSPTGRSAISLSFSRLFDERPGYGYPGVRDPWRDERAPDGDGLYHMDLDSGGATMILSLAQAASLGERQPGMDTGKHRFNHVQWNTDGTRFAVLHRWSVPWGGWLTRLLTMNADGSDLYVLSDHHFFSHYDWRDADTVLGWARRADRGNHYYLFTDRTQDVEIVGNDFFTVDGHCSYSPDRKWILTDTYPDGDGFRTLILFDIAAERRIDIARLHGPTPPDGEIRCDLHPRWSRDGRQVCIDSVHEDGERQMYVLYVDAVTDVGYAR